LAARQAAAAARAPAAVRALPPVELQLKRRTATSIVVYWTTDSPPAPPADGEDEDDGGMDAGANPVSALLAAIPAPPVYEVAYRQAHRTKNPTARRGGKHTAEEPAPPPPAPGPQAPWRYVLVTTGHAATVEPLQPNTLYELQCRRKWWSEAFGPPVVIRSGPGAPEAPPGLCIQEITSSSVMIAWQVQGLPRALLRFPLYLDPSQPLCKSLSAVPFGPLSCMIGA